MSATHGRDDGRHDAGGGELVESDDHLYFLTIEEHFLRLRGAPMMLSPADWQIAKAWAGLGVPVRVACSVMDRVFEQRQERGAKGRVQGLRYFDDAVRAAWQEALELRGPAPSTAAPRSEIDVRRRLDELCDALPVALPSRERWVARIRASAPPTAGPELDVQAVEESLRAIERDLLSEARGWLDREELEAEEAEVARALDALRGRLPPAAVGHTAARLLDRRLRDRLDLPELSLFAPRPRS